MPDSSIDITSRTRVSLDWRFIGIRLFDKQKLMNYIILITNLCSLSDEERSIWYLDRFCLFIASLSQALYILEITQKSVSWITNIIIHRVPWKSSFWNLSSLLH